MGVSLATDVEFRAGRPKPYWARVRWVDPETGDYPSISEPHATRNAADDWIVCMERAAASGVDPAMAEMALGEYGDHNLSVAIRGLAAKTTDPYLAGWRKRVKPALGHLPVRMVTYGAVDRAAMVGLLTGAANPRSRIALPCWFA
jgi:hypothetical protein